MEDDELRVLRLLDIPRTKGELLESTGLEEERVRTIVQMLKRSDLAQLIEGKRWARTDFGTARLEEAEEEPEPPFKEGFTKRFEINRKRRDVLNKCEEARSELKRNWEEELLKDAESLKNDISFIEQSLDEARSVEELEELEGLIIELNKTVDKIRGRDNVLYNRKLMAEEKRKLNLIKKYHFTNFPTIPYKHLKERFEMFEKNPNLLEDFYQRIEFEEHLGHLLDNAVKYGVHPDFIQYISDMAKPKKLEIDYILKIWDEYDELSSRYGPQMANGFLNNYGPNLLKRGGDLWQSFHRHMPPPRRPAPV